MIAFPKEELVYDKDRWTIYRQDIGMGEVQYAVFFKDQYICTAGALDTAQQIAGTFFGPRYKPSKITISRVTQ